MKLRTGHQNRNGEGCRLAQILILAMALPLTAPSVLGVEGINGEPEPAPVCRASDLITITAEEGARATYPVVDPSIPGWWRQELKLQTPELRDPSTLSILPPSPARAEASTDGRWVPGYRPATPLAHAELEAWKAGRNSAMAGLAGAEVPSTSISNYGANLLRGERVEHVADEEITRSVHPEPYEVSTIHVSEIRATEERPASRGPASDIHHGSGMTWNEYLLAKELAQTSPTTPEAQEATARNQRAPGAQGVAFDAIVSNFSSVPPDPIMAAGPSHLVAIVNNRYQVWDKAGNPLTTDITMNAFFDGVENCSGVFDVFVDYDEAADRFVMGGMSVFQTIGVDSYICIAASATGDPTGAWHRAGFRADASAPETWIDFPHTGIGLDEIYISGNMFGDSSGFNHIRIFAVDKDALYAGTPITVVDASLGSLFFTAQPVKLHGYTSGGWPAPGTPHHFIAHDSGGNSRIWRWSDPFNIDPVIYGTVVEESFGGLPPNAPELDGTSSNLNDSGSAKWLDAEYRGGRLWATRNVACDFGGGASESCIDWVQIDVSGPAPVLEQQQTGGGYGSTGDFRYYPDLSVDRNNNIALGYTKSSLTTYTEVWVTGREFGDTAGTLQPEILQRAGLGMYTDGAGCQGSCDRWGDYTGLTVDPDGCTFWYLGQYSDGGTWNWGTHIGSFRFSTCSVDSSLQVDKGTVTCDDAIAITVTDTTLINATTVSAQTTVSSSGGDSETIPAGSWVGSDCVGNDCGSWTTTLPVSGDPGSDDDGTLNVADAETISAVYLDPHAGHDDHTRNIAVTCRTRLDDGGYIIDGGCEGAQGAERYRDYMDGGEYIAYTFGIFNPQTAPPLTDVAATLTISGPAADKVTIFNPSIYIGSLDSGTLTATVFQLYIDPSIDGGGFRMSEHDFELNVTSVADGFTALQVLTQSHLLQADDNIVEESQCWNFESGDQGFVRDIYDYSYPCGSAEGCSSPRTIYTTAAPWTHGGGCGSETRDDYPEMTCDTAGTSAFMSNADGAACNDFTQTDNTITDDVLYSPIFAPAHTGSAANGQPWYFNWSYAEWFYRSQMVSGLDPAMVLGMFWDDDYRGVAAPAYNEVDTHYSYFRGFIYYANQDWDSSVPWDPTDPPANFDGAGFGGASSAATPGLQWRWAVEVFDADLGSNPTETPATAGLSLDNLNLAYDQYHADEQIGSCVDPPAVASLDQLIYLQCPDDGLGVSVLDGSATGSVRVTVTSLDGGDSETFSIYGTGPYFVTTLPYSTAGGPRDNDGTLFVLPSDTVTLTYDGSTATSTAVSYINCEGGDVVVAGVAGLSDNGDGDAYADTNETVDISIRIQNNTDQPLQNVTVTIATDDPAVDCILKDTASFGTIEAAGATGTNDLGTDPFTFKVSNQATCVDPISPPTATFEVLIQADGFAGPVTPQRLTMVLDMNDLPGTITFTEDFTTNPPGFYHELGPGDDNGVATGPGGLACSPYVDEFFWSATGGNSGGGYFCWQDPADTFPNGTYSDLNDSALYSPVFKIGAISTTLSFDHEYQFAWSGTYRIDGARVDYRVNGGVWQKLTTLPYDGDLIWNSYCNPLCNGSEFGLPCFSENPGEGEQIFNQLDQGTVNWTSVAGDITGLNTDDLVQLRWRVGSMNSSAYGISTDGGYGLDNVSLSNVIQQECDTAVHPDTGCGVIYDEFGNLVELCGDGDLVVEPTELWSVDVTLRNSASTDAPNTTADLVVSGGTPVLANVTNNPGSFGTIAANGGTATASYEFSVDPGGVCINDILFDVNDITDDGATYKDEPSAFAVPIGGVSAQETSTQSVDPIDASNGSAASSLLPALTIPGPAYTVTVDYSSSYTNVAPTDVGVQSTDPLTVENGAATSLLSPAASFSVANAVSVVADWASLTHPKVLECTRVYLRTPNGANFTLKAVDEAPANPYDISYVYSSPSGGPGQYQIGLEEVASGPCKQSATLTGATMTITGPSSAGSSTLSTRVALWDGATEHVLKGYGDVDSKPHDVTAIYNAAGPGVYELRLEEGGSGGVATLSGGTITAVGIECDLGCSSFVPPAPPLADGTFGSPLTLDRGVGPDDLELAIDNATCSAGRAVVVYGNIGDYSTYQGAVDVGCDLGTGPTGTVTHAGDNVWFNVIWVNDNDDAGHPGFDSSGARTWSAAGLCGVVSDDTSDAVCD